MMIEDQRVICQALGQGALVVWLVLAGTGAIQWLIERWQDAEKK